MTKQSDIHAIHGFIDELLPLLSKFYLCIHNQRGIEDGTALEIKVSNKPFFMPSEDDQVNRKETSLSVCLRDLVAWRDTGRLSELPRSMAGDVVRKLTEAEI